MALFEILDAAHRSLNMGRFVCIVSFDVSRASDNVSHYGLIGVFERFGASRFER